MHLCIFQIFLLYFFNLQRCFEIYFPAQDELEIKHDSTAEYLGKLQYKVRKGNINVRIVNIYVHC